MKSIEELNYLCDNTTDIDDFVKTAIKKFKESEQLYHEYMYYLVDKRIRGLFDEVLGIKNINRKEKLEQIVGLVNKKPMIAVFENKSDLFFPRPVMRTQSFVILCMLILIPIILVISLIFFVPETIPFILEVIIIGGGFVLIFSLVAVVHFTKPELLSANEFLKVETFDDFVINVVSLNQYFYQINNFQKTKNELINYYLAQKRGKNSN